jgi:hypothetical protein
MIFLGGDPDMHTCGLATVDENLKPTWVGCLRVDAKYKEQEAIVRMVQRINTHWFNAMPVEQENSYAVESQEMYRYGRQSDTNPRNLLHLAHISGALLCRLNYIFPGGGGYLPKPAEWKGTVDKLVYQKWILQKAGVPFNTVVVLGGKKPYCSLLTSDIPGSSDLNPGDWKHVVDAIGLAQYAATRYLKESRKAAALAAVRV